MAASLLDHQFEFAEKLARLYTHIISSGYKFSLGDSYRPPETAALYAAQGKGITNSLHCLRLAQDLNIFLDNKIIISKSGLWSIGTYWEDLSWGEFNFHWGGNFKNLDVFHFSLGYGGRK